MINEGQLHRGHMIRIGARWIHEGSHSGQLRAAIVFLTGIFPTIFAVAGIIMWLRKCQKCRGATTPR